MVRGSVTRLGGAERPIDRDKLGLVATRPSQCYCEKMSLWKYLSIASVGGSEERRQIAMPLRCPSRRRRATGPTCSVHGDTNGLARAASRVGIDFLARVANDRVAGF